MTQLELSQPQFLFRNSLKGFERVLGGRIAFTTHVNMERVTPQSICRVDTSSRQVNTTPTPDL